VGVRQVARGGWGGGAENWWPDAVVAAVAGPGRAVGLVMSKIGVALWTPGQVERGFEKRQAAGQEVFRAGEHDGTVTPRVEALAKMLSIVDGARVTDNLWGERWAKLSQNAMSNPVQGMSGLGSVEQAVSEAGRAGKRQLTAGSARGRPRRWPGAG